MHIGVERGYRAEKKEEEAPPLSFPPLFLQHVLTASRGTAQPQKRGKNEPDGIGGKTDVAAEKEDKGNDPQNEDSPEESLFHEEQRSASERKQKLVA